MSTNDPRASIETSTTVRSSDAVTRFLGGSPLAVAGRLILLSVLVGFVMVTFGLDPYNIIRSIQRLFETIWNLGFDAIDWLWRYFLLGAVIVIPIWLIMRFDERAEGAVASDATCLRSSPRKRGPGVTHSRISARRGNERRLLAACGNETITPAMAAR